MKKISVIIPVFNNEKYLRKCVDSVLTQTYSNLEIILINDGSTDLSGNICNEYASFDSRIRVIHKQNGGVSSARNCGLEIATGEFVSFVDGDDELEQDMYSFLSEKLNEFDTDIAHCGYKRVNENGDLVKEVSGTHEVILQNSHDAIECLLKGVYFTGGLWNKLYKCEVLKGLYFCDDLANNEDILFNVQAFNRAKSIVFADETKYKYYEHLSSACNQMHSIKKSQDSILACHRMLESVFDSDIKRIICERLFQMQINLYRIILLNGNNTVMLNDIKQEIKKSFKQLVSPSLKNKLNYFLIMRFSQGYKYLYLIYDKIRKPNWDVEREK